MFVDTAVSILVLLAVSPVLLAVTIAAALRSGAPKVYGHPGPTGTIDITSREVSG
jgi:lipopolysaccharide/colanic/teichoic acid biosynthesis glycosyltransferase